MKQLILFAGLIGLCAWNHVGVAARLPQMRISVENSATHVQAKSVKRFANEIRQKLKGRIDVKFFQNARLFRDKDVIQAVHQGKLEMAVPGTWHVSRFVPNISVFLLPAFYGRSAQDTYKLLDSDVGEVLNRGIEDKLQLKVLGRWIDLGHAHLFGVNQKITRHEDIQGMKVRVAGGIANELRIAALGGLPVSIAWPDLPVYLQQGKVDAVLTSYESIKSARLWEKGIRFVFEDREYFPQYIPLIRLAFWRKLSPDTQQTIFNTWEKYVDLARKQAAEAQISAKRILIEKGVKIVVPTSERLVFWRRHIISHQPKIIEKLKIDHDLVDRISEILTD